MNLSPEVKKERVKAYLSHIRGIEDNLSTVTEDIERLKASLTLSGVNVSDKVRMTTRTDSLSAGVIRLIEMQEKACTEYASLFSEYAHAQSLCLTSSHHESLSVLWDRYVKVKSYRVMACERNVSERQIHRLTRVGIPILFDLMPDEFK